ncbi:MAG: hypothetical protein JNK19_10455 [Tabrizicola sp.]|nr:hypothetical protein [Tabrizicola sp.]
MEQQLKMMMAQNALMAARISAIEDLLVKGVAGSFIPGGGVTDPPPDGDGIRGGIGGILADLVGVSRFKFPKIPINWDPVPEELFRLDRLQLESRLADVAQFRAKLDAFEGSVKAALEKQG